MDDHRQAISDALEESFATIDSSVSGPTLEYSEIRNTDRRSEIRNPSIESGPETATLEFGPETCSSSDHSSEDEESGGKIQKFSHPNNNNKNNNNNSHVQVNCDNVPNQSNFAIENHQKPKISVNSNIENSNVPLGESKCFQKFFHFRVIFHDFFQKCY